MTCFPNHSSTCQQVPCCASTTNYCIASGNLACLLPHSSVVRYDPIAFLSLALVPVEPYQPLLVLSSACFQLALTHYCLLDDRRSFLSWTRSVTCALECCLLRLSKGRPSSFSSSSIVYWLCARLFLLYRSLPCQLDPNGFRWGRYRSPHCLQ